MIDFFDMRYPEMRMQCVHCFAVEVTCCPILKHEIHSPLCNALEALVSERYLPDSVLQSDVIDFGSAV